MKISEFLKKKKWEVDKIQVDRAEWDSLLGV